MCETGSARVGTVALNWRTLMAMTHVINPAARIVLNVLEARHRHLCYQLEEAQRCCDNEQYENDLFDRITDLEQSIVEFIDENPGCNS